MRRRTAGTSRWRRGAWGGLGPAGSWEERRPGCSCSEKRETGRVKRGESWDVGEEEGDRPTPPPLLRMGGGRAWGAAEEAGDGCAPSVGRGLPGSPPASRRTPPAPPGLSPSPVGTVPSSQREARACPAAVMAMADAVPGSGGGPGTAPRPPPRVSSPSPRWPGDAGLLRGGPGGGRAALPDAAVTGVSGWVGSRCQPTPSSPGNPPFFGAFSVSGARFRSLWHRRLKEPTVPKQRSWGLPPPGPISRGFVPSAGPSPATAPSVTVTGVLAVWPPPPPPTLPLPAVAQSPAQGGGAEGFSGVGEQPGVVITRAPHGVELIFPPRAAPAQLSPTHTCAESARAQLGPPRHDTPRI